MEEFREGTDGTAYYNGQELAEEDLDLIESAMKIALEQIKIKNNELGHCVLHTKSTCFFTSINYINKGKKEHEANLFAAEFLIYDVDPVILEGYSINQLAAYYEVPSELVELK